MLQLCRQKRSIIVFCCWCSMNLLPHSFANLLLLNLVLIDVLVQANSCLAPVHASFNVLFSVVHNVFMLCLVMTIAAATWLMLVFFVVNNLNIFLFSAFRFVSKVWLNWPKNWMHFEIFCFFLSYKKCSESICQNPGIIISTLSSFWKFYSSQALKKTFENYKISQNILKQSKTSKDIL